MTAASAHPQPNGSSPLSPTPSTSVFNALGSYADRIRDKEMKDGHFSAAGSSSKKSPKPLDPTDLPNGSASHPAAASASGSSSKLAKSGTMPPPPAPKAASAAKPRGAKDKEDKAPEKEADAPKEEEGAWETVPAGKLRRKEKEATATSSNWRDRPKEKRESSAWRNGGEDEKVKGESRKKNVQVGGAPSSTTRSTSSHPIASTSAPTATPTAAARSASVTPATTTRKAWGVITPSPSTSTATPSTSMSNPLPGQTPNSTPAPKPTASQPPKSIPTARTTTPPSPTVTGVSTAVNTSVSESVASPSLSATASTATMVTPRGDREEDEDWRMRPRKLSTEMVEKDLPEGAGQVAEGKAVEVKAAEPEIKETPQAAAPPAVNAWAARQKATGPQPTPQPSSHPAFPAALSSSSITKLSTIIPTSNMASKTSLPNKPSALLFGSVEINEKSLPNGHAEPSLGGGDAGVKIGAVKKKKAQGPASGPRHVVDPAAFPDLAQAAKATKDVARSGKDKELEGSVVDEAAAGARKTKWTAIPAAELLAAADEAKRHAQAIASRQKQQQSSSQPRTLPSSTSGAAESSLSPNAKTPRKKSLETRKGRVARSGSGSEIRLPPNPTRRRNSGSTAGGSGSVGADGLKPVFGSIGGGADGEQAQKEGGLPMGVASEPISRQSTSASQQSSPHRSRTQLPSPSDHKNHPLPSMADMPGMRFGAGPLSANGNTSGSGGALGSSTAPMPQSGFPSSGTNGATFGIPRASKGPRQPSFSGPTRGRGAFRGGYRSSMAGSLAMGSADSAYLSNGLSRGPPGAGGYSTFVPQSQQHGSAGGYEGGQGMYGGWDPAQAYMPSLFGTPGGSQSRQGLPMPPPPMPVTQAAGLDALRFYVLGQVEYYFSMQNLAMDFFLRQQMDSEGWIDIAMITSFNRVKSLTPDLTIVKEVMLLSSILEVRDDKVRLSHGESKRWILPDAKPSPFVDDSPSPAGGEEGESGELGLIGYGSIPIANGDGAAVMGLGLEGREVLVKGVENALMRPRDPITGLLSTPVSVVMTTETEAGTEAGTDAGTDGDEVDADDKADGKGLGLTGTSLSSASEEAEKVELR